VSVSATQAVVSIASLPTETNPPPALELINPDGQGTGLRLGSDVLTAAQQSNSNAANDEASVHAVAGSNAAGIAHGIAHGIALYPNPATDELFVESALEGAPVRVVNALGVVLAEGRIASGVVRFAVRDWSQGAYTVEVVAGSKRVMKRFVKY
jgi:hypothetical protein